MSDTILDFEGFRLLTENYRNIKSVKIQRFNTEQQKEKGLSTLVNCMLTINYINGKNQTLLTDYFLCLRCFNHLVFRGLPVVVIKPDMQEVSCTSRSPEYSDLLYTR